MNNLRNIATLFVLLLAVCSKAQHTSLEALGSTIVQSLTTNDTSLFKSTILPKDTLIAIILSDTSLSEAEKERRRPFFEGLDKSFYPMFLLNFKLLQYKVAAFDLEFDTMSTTTALEPMLNGNFNIRGQIRIYHDEFTHLFFYPVEYNNRYYLKSPTLYIEEN